jgi:lipopolysaccharide export system protein LptA
MCTGSFCLPIMRYLRNNLALFALSLITGMSSAFALESDRDQQMAIDANYSKLSDSPRDEPTKPRIDLLDGNVLITQGSMKANGDHATIYRNGAGVVDANGNKGALTRVVLIGKQAHMQQVHDGDCMLITTNADTIDFHNDNNTAILTGNVIVLQKGKGQFHGEHMIYNTKTGAMEGGDQTGNSRVHIVMEPKDETPAVANTNNCGFPLGNYKPKAEKAAAAKTAEHT